MSVRLPEAIFDVLVYCANQGTFVRSWILSKICSLLRFSIATIQKVIGVIKKTIHHQIFEKFGSTKDLQISINFFALFPNSHLSYAIIWSPYSPASRTTLERATDVGHRSDVGHRLSKPEEVLSHLRWGNLLWCAWFRSGVAPRYANLAWPGRASTPLVLRWTLSDYWCTDQKRRRPKKHLLKWRWRETIRLFPQRKLVVHRPLIVASNTNLI